MKSASGRWICVFNGEIYNHPTLRRELEREGLEFRGHSDTETLLAAVECWGLERALKRFIGMFAIALWDTHKRALHLVRDRIGIKPLFVYHHRGTLAFASELKAFKRLPGADLSLDREALVSYLRYLYVPSPRTIYSRVSKFPAGNILTITDPSVKGLSPTPYWSLEEAARCGLEDPISLPDDEVIAEGERLLSDAVSRRMIADVPLGAFLSGGIDSSLVVALMQAASSKPVRTFTVGFDAAEHDEAHHAAAVAEHLGTEHHESRLSGQDALDLVPRIPAMFDEPFANPAALPYYLVCAAARRDVVVALAGVGGDELFGGYNRHIHGHKIIESVSRVPQAPRRLAAGVLSRVGAAPLASLERAARQLLPGVGETRLAEEKIRKLTSLLRLPGPTEMYRSLMSAWSDPARFVIGGNEPRVFLDRLLGGAEPEDFLGRVMLADQLTYLQDDQLCMADRASMAVSLEVRVPLLDHRVTEFSWRLPRHWKVRGSQGKYLLREVLYRRVPRQLLERPKMGFSVPLEAWLRGPLRPWAEDLLAERRLKDDGIFDATEVRAAWRNFQDDGEDSALGLWSILMFQAWYDQASHR